MVKQKKFSFIDKIISMTNLNAQKILNVYSYVLLIFPIAFWILINLQALLVKTNLKRLLHNNPLMLVGIIISIIDFVFGYYLMLNKKNILSDRFSYKITMLSQMICQLLVGNVLCFFLALLGTHESKTLNEQESIHRKANITVTIIISGVLLISFLLILVIKFKGERNV